MLHGKIDVPALRIAIVFCVMLIGAVAYASLSGLILVATVLKHEGFAQFTAILAIFVIICSHFVMFSLQARVSGWACFIRVVMLAALQAMLLFSITGAMIVSVSSLLNADPLFLARHFRAYLYIRYFGISFILFGMYFAVWQIHFMRKSLPQ